MLHNLDLVLYFWLFPVFLLLILPLILATGGFLFDLIRRLFPSRKAVAKEKRSDPRFVPSAGAFAEIRAGDMTCTGLVCNISRLGISLKNIPDIFFDKMDKLTIVIRGEGGDQNLLVKPKWVLETSSGKQLGAKIDSAPPGWRQFLMQTGKMEPSGLA
ncbi:MAG: hypothetical protein KJ804_19450 [Proteobacteria bacterium]|nr:hypothetical protein [Pseudomonadota bacterium]MBU1060484.1 hypothetical protein [Pseudomonadota bacterium]